MGEERHQHQSDHPYYEQYVDGDKIIYEISASGYENGAIVHPSSRVDYQYDGNTLVGEMITARNEDGSIVSSVSYEWIIETIPPKITIRRKVRI